MNLSKSDYKICIIGLGYVGLPLATRFSLKGFDVLGFDINKTRIEELKSSIDSNNDMDPAEINNLLEGCKLSSNEEDLKDRNIFIVTVPTPINEDKTPDLGPIISSSDLVGSFISKDSIVIYESTVYPGVTDDICTPILEEKSGLIFNQDFFTGYSPERIVPGDKINTIEKIKKVVSGSNPEVLKIVAFLYSSIIDAGIHLAPSIKIAEASKVTENIQRDVNIALINELHQMYTLLGIDTHEVIEAASTKWNFMKLKPGLVGGHCISIDPYYLMHKSMMTGYTPNLMRTARDINDGMGEWVVELFLKFINREKIDLSSVNITFLGYTFKENCSDTRNTKVKDLIYSVKGLGIKVSLWDPLLDMSQLNDLESDGIEVYKSKPKNIQFAFLCVLHDEILEFLETHDGYLFDYKRQ
jgi:UDP-N-acetyl-D-galactosamine dehydrogenase|tara:strand:- start:9570 stop:10808 length:1239 start_codon:yes stop_codon:yes gene_type:complete